VRILYWSEIFPPYTGGTEMVGVTLVEGLRDRGYELSVVTSHGDRDLPDHDEHDGVPVRRLPFLAAARTRNPALIGDVMQRATAIKRSFRPDIVHVNAVGASLLFHLRSDRSPRTPWVFTPHAPLTDQATGDDTILGQAFRTADWVVSVSRAQREAILRIAPGTAARSSVIYNALPPPPFEPAPPPMTPPRILCLGRHVRDKGFDVALDAFARIADRFPESRLTIAGDGPERAALQRQASELGIAERVDFPGRVPEVHPYFEAATLVVMPSRWEETFGLVALEAALMGRAVVATRVGALPEVVQDEVTGLVVESEDSAGLALAIASLLERPTVVRRMGRAARERALEAFSLPRCIDRYEELYRRLAAGEMAVQGSGV
jgi:glycogen(starch) synthase